jgi:hypothetical protein
MPKAGRYDYPFRELDDCIEYLRKANELTKEHSFTREQFAAAIGQKVTGGGFAMLVGSMATYKLVDTGGGRVIYTDLAKKILHGLDKDKEVAKSQAARNIILFADIYDKFGASPTTEQLYRFLQDKANVDISEANHLAKEIGKLFNKVAIYLKTDASEVPATAGGGGKKEVKEEGAFESDTTIEHFKLGGGIEIKLPKENTTAAWDRAKKALNIILGVNDNSDQK